MSRNEFGSDLPELNLKLNEKLNRLHLKDLSWWCIQKGLEKNIIPKKKAIYKVKYLNFSFLNDIFNLRQEKSYFSLGESSG